MPNAVEVPASARDAVAYAALEAVDDWLTAFTVCLRETDGLARRRAAICAVPGGRGGALNEVGGC
jgi:hypothetical protein